MSHKYPKPGWLGFSGDDSSFRPLRVPPKIDQPFHWRGPIEAKECDCLGFVFVDDFLGIL